MPVWFRALLPFQPFQKEDEEKEEEEKEEGTEVWKHVSYLSATKTRVQLSSQLLRPRPAEYVSQNESLPASSLAPAASLVTPLAMPSRCPYRRVGRHGRGFRV